MTQHDMTERAAAEAAAKERCFQDCSAGLHLDFEAGCCSVCKSPSQCQGWMPYLKGANP